MKFRRILALALAAAVCAACFAGCKGEESSSAPETPVNTIRNDGRAAKLVLGEIAFSDERTALLKEIAEKYRADFPETEIEVRTFGSAEELGQALRNGELDLAEVSDKTQPGYVREGLLLDIAQYLSRWNESVTLTNEAQQAVFSLGRDHSYLIPCGFAQDLLYLRKDWFDEYNEGRESDYLRVRTWDELSGGFIDGKDYRGAPQKLGEDRGRLAIAGKDKLADYFDAMLWSTLSLGRLADPAAAYFFRSEEGQTIFLHEKAAQEAMDQFLRVLDLSLLPESLDWTEEQAVEAFLDGRTGLLLASRDVLPRLREAMPEGTLRIDPFPRGRTGTAISFNSFSGWGISADAKEPEIAAHFLTFLSNADNNTYYAKVVGSVPIHQEAMDLEPSLGRGNRAAEAEMIKQKDWYQFASPPTMYLAYEGYRELLNEKLRQLAAGTLTRDELMSSLDEYWMNAYRTEGKLY